MPEIDLKSEEMNGDTCLLDFFEECYLAERSISRIYRNNIRSKIAFFSDFLRRHAVLSDLNRRTVNAWLMHLETLGMKAKTIHGQYRGMILCLWRMAYENEFIDNPVRGVRNVKQERRIPDAWTHKELLLMLQACDRRPLSLRSLKGTCFTRSWGDWLKAFILFTYDSALRIGDAMTISRKDIQEDGSFIILQHKTGCELVRRLRPETVKAIDVLYHPEYTEPLFGFIHRASVRKMWHLLLKEADMKKHWRNGPQKLRRTSVSHLESIAPGTSQYHLGHLTPGLAHRHYIDPRIARVEIPLPPALPPIGGTEQ